MQAANDTKIRLGQRTLFADVTVPDECRGVVVFAHGSGSGRHSPRNRHVASVLNDAGLATVLADLLTDDEERIDRQTAHLRFDIPFLAERVAALAEWAADEPALAGARLGVFGASTGGGAALFAAAHSPDVISAVVSRGGRPDLAAAALPAVRAPTLLVVGGNDTVVLDWNRQAYTALTCERRLEVVDGAGHLFEEPGALERVAALARDWFLAHLG